MWGCAHDILLHDVMQHTHNCRASTQAAQRHADARLFGCIRAWDMQVLAGNIVRDRLSAEIEGKAGQQTCLEDGCRIHEAKAKVRGLQVVQRLAHVSICREDDCFQALFDVWHLQRGCLVLARFLPCQRYEWTGRPHSTAKLKGLAPEFLLGLGLGFEV